MEFSRNFFLLKDNIIMGRIDHHQLYIYRGILILSISSNSIIIPGFPLLF